MQHAAIATVAERLRLSWDEAAGIQARAVQCGLTRRHATPARHLGIDETAFVRRHQYGTVVTDLDRGQVRYVAVDRRQASLDAVWPQLTAAELAALEAAAMDMWEPYIASTGRICGTPTPRSSSTSSTVLSRPTRRSTRYAGRRTGRCTPRATTGWSARGSTGSAIRRGSPGRPGASSSGFVRRTKLKTGRASALQEMLMTLWDYVYPAAERHFEDWYAWAIRSRLEPLKAVARLVRRHWPNIKTFFTRQITNAGAESMNSKIQRIEVLARGFRNRERFRMARAEWSWRGPIASSEPQGGPA